MPCRRFVYEHRGSVKASSSCDCVTGKSGWSSFATWYLRPLHDGRGPVPGDERKHRVSSETRPPGAGSWRLIARLPLGSASKLSRVTTRVIRVSQPFGGAEPQPLLFPVLNLIDIPPYAHKHIHIHTHHPHLLMQPSNLAYSGVLYWNSDSFRGSF